MTGAAMKAYRFALPDQWGAGLKDRLVFTGAGGSLSPVPRWPRIARAKGPRQPIDAVALAPDGLLLGRGSAPATLSRAPLWLIRNGRADEGPVEIGGTLALSRRIVADDEATWAFSVRQVERYDLDTLTIDRAVGISRLLDDTAGAGILDIATAPCGGLWVLVALPDGRLLVQVDRAGCVRSRLALDCRLNAVDEVAGLDGGKAVALFLAREQRIFIVAVATGKLLFAPSAAQFNLAGRWLRMASDGLGRLALLSRPAGPCTDLAIGKSGQDTDLPNGAATHLAEAILFLDAEGEALQPAFRPELDGDGPVPTATDIALSRDQLVLATTSGVFAVGNAGVRRGEAAGTVEASGSGVFLTPALSSIPNAGGEGWLRAECWVTLPSGAMLTCTAAGTSDPLLAERVKALAADRSMAAAARLAAAWALLGDEGNVLPPMMLSGPLGDGTPLDDTLIEVPLYGLRDRTIWLRLDLEVSQGGPNASVHELSILYPDASLMALLPAVFSNSTTGNPSTLRDLVGVIETTSHAIDGWIAGIGQLVQPATAATDWLDRIADWTDMPWHDALPLEAKRRLVERAGEMIRLRGTRAGLHLLLERLLPDGTEVEITDSGADHRPMVLGGGAQCGAPIPFLLAGEPRSTPRLGTGAVVGRMRLLCGTVPDPLDAVLPTLRIVIWAAPSVRRTFAPLLRTVVAQVVPATVHLRINWRMPGSTDVLLAVGAPLDDDGPRALARNAEIGRTVVAGRSAYPFTSSGQATGFTLS